MMIAKTLFCAVTVSLLANPFISPSFADDTPPATDSNYSCELKSGSTSTPLSLPATINSTTTVAIQGSGTLTLSLNKPGTYHISLAVTGSSTPVEDDISTSSGYITSVAVQGGGLISVVCKTKNPLTTDNGATTQVGATQVDTLKSDADKIAAATSSNPLTCNVPGAPAGMIVVNNVCLNTGYTGSNGCCPSNYEGYNMVQSSVSGVDACCVVGYPQTTQYCMPLASLMSQGQSGCSIVSSSTNSSQSTTPVPSSATQIPDSKSTAAAQ